MSHILLQTDERLRSGAAAEDRVWPTGFDLLDRALGGGLRSTGLVLLAGPQGLGKTTFALQVARNVARSGRAVVLFSFEHEPEDLMSRLVALEAGELDDTETSGLTAIRAALESLGGIDSLEERLSTSDCGLEALELVRSYADRLLVHRSTGSSTDLLAIRAAIDQAHELTGQVPLVVVDYLQKVQVPGGSLGQDERTTIVAEGLKDVAIEFGVPVLAVVATDRSGLVPGKRMRMNHLRGSSALGYEADVVLILNSKFDIVARHHLVYDLNNAERFREWAILSIEKNRFGRDGVDLEYQKRFDQSRFESTGQQVTEQLVDERVFTE